MNGIQNLIFNRFQSRSRRAMLGKSSQSIRLADIAAEIGISDAQLREEIATLQEDGWLNLGDANLSQLRFLKPMSMTVFLTASDQGQIPGLADGDDEAPADNTIHLNLEVPPDFTIGRDQYRKYLDPQEDASFNLRIVENEGSDFERVAFTEIALEDVPACHDAAVAWFDRRQKDVTFEWRADAGQGEVLFSAEARLCERLSDPADESSPREYTVIVDFGRIGNWTIQNHELPACAGDDAAWSEFTEFTRAMVMEVDYFYQCFAGRNVDISFEPGALAQLSEALAFGALQADKGMVNVDEGWAVYNVGQDGGAILHIHQLEVEPCEDGDLFDTAGNCIRRTGGERFLLNNEDTRAMNALTEYIAAIHPPERNQDRELVDVAPEILHDCGNRIAQSVLSAEKGLLSPVTLPNGCLCAVRRVIKDEFDAVAAAVLVELVTDVESEIVYKVSRNKVGIKPGKREFVAYNSGAAGYQRYIDALVEEVTA